MRIIQPPFQKSAVGNASIFAADLPRLADNWFMAGEINRHSERTTQARRDLLKKLSSGRIFRDGINWFISLATEPATMP